MLPTISVSCPLSIVHCPLSTVFFPRHCQLSTALSTAHCMLQQLDLTVIFARVICQGLFLNLRGADQTFLGSSGFRGTGSWSCVRTTQLAISLAWWSGTTPVKTSCGFLSASMWRLSHTLSTSGSIQRTPVTLSCG